tara:strand:- start:1800 stop:2549 length:750 start_codon:yes stop_codon:yes gene_type:complete
MIKNRRISTSRWWNNKKIWIVFIFFILIFFIRFSRSLIFKDVFYFISKPFWPGEYQHQILLKSANKELNIKLNQLEKDNIRLRKVLVLQNVVDKNKINSSVISRNMGSWWRQILLNKGSNDGINYGDAVIGPGGLIGIIKDISKFTSSVQLLTSPDSKVGVWNQRTNLSGLLIGVGTNTPKLIFYSKNVDVQIGDNILSSPASTLLPPNIPVGIVQSVDNKSGSSTTASVQLIANPEAIDWVQIIKIKF